jgi:uncharacterized LabA/DUF88 family protein
MPGLRIMTFYDGAYFKSGQVWFRYKDNRGWFSIPKLHGLLEKYVAQKAKEPLKPTKVVGAHYYDGRGSVQAIEPDQVKADRRFELALIQGGVVSHSLPVRETPKVGPASDDRQFNLAQKDIDVQYALDVLDDAHTNRCDVAVLVTGDADFVPLVRKITSIGKHALIGHFQIDPWTDSSGQNHRGTFCSRDLLDGASWSLNFNHLGKDRDWKEDVENLFFQPKAKE